MSDWAIRTRNLGKRYALYARPIDRVRELVSLGRRVHHEDVWALRGVDLEIAPGTVTGLVGVNGAGKSTFLKLTAGKLRPTEGTIEAKGRISSILELGTGFQPHLTGRQNALVNSLFLGQRPWEAEGRIDEILAFAELGHYSDQPLATYSSGMQARLAFSVLTTLDPEILILDEALATGDTGFAEKCKTFLRGLCRSGCTTVVASHDYAFVAEACDKVVWIDHGRVREQGDPRTIVQAYLTEIGRRDASLDPRPKHVLVRLEGRDAAKKASYVAHSFEWLGPAGEIVGEHYIADEQIFAHCLSAAIQVGLTPGAAEAGWGPRQDLGPRGGGCRALRPDLGPGGAAYVALPVPPVPRPVPAQLRVGIHRGQVATPLVVSVLANGRFVELGAIDAASTPWERSVFDAAPAFAAAGSRAPAFDEALVP